MSKVWPPLRAMRLPPDREELFREMLSQPLREDGSEPWQNFDPPFQRSTIRALELANLIETEGKGRDTQHRFKVSGRERAALALQAGRRSEVTP